MLFAKRQNPTEPTYPTWQCALSQCGKGYEDADLVRAIYEKTKAYRKELAEAMDGICLQPYVIQSALAVATAIKNRETKFAARVLDFGGGCGIRRFEIEEFMPDVALLWWWVVDSTAMSEINESDFHIDKITNWQLPINLLHCSGSIQYIDPAENILSHLLALDARYALFSRLWLTDGPEPVITVQESRLSDNGPGKMPAGMVDKLVRYPRVAYPEKWFLGEIKRAGYSVVWKTESGGKLNSVFLRKE